MLVISDRLIDISVMSLQTGAEIARTHKAIIDPTKLSIIGFYVTGPRLDVQPAVLRVDDIREVSDIGFIINSSDELVEPSEIIAIQNVIDYGFDVESLSVIDEKKHKIGKVTHYTVEIESFTIQQVNVKRPLLKSIQVSELLINRRQIVEVTNDHIVISSSNESAQATASHPIKQSITNPFRSPQVENNT